MARGAQTVDEVPAEAMQNTLVQVGEDGRLNLNFRDMPASSFEPIDPGSYRAVVSGSKLKKTGPNSKKPGSPMVEIKFTLRGEGVDNRSVWRNYTLTPESMWAFKQFLARTGQYTDDELASEDFEYDANDIMGAEVVVAIENRKYTDNDGQEKIQNDVKEVKADDGSSDWS